MNLTITINLDNDAFQEDCLTEEVARILAGCIDKLKEQWHRAECLCTAPEAADVLYDINGNRCGAITLTPDNPPKRAVPTKEITICGIPTRVNLHWYNWVLYLAQHGDTPEARRLRDLYRESEGLPL